MADSIEIVTGILLLGWLVPYSGAIVGMIRANLGGQFFAEPVERKVVILSHHPGEWRLITYAWIGVMMVLVAGVASFSTLMADAGMGALAWAVFGAATVASLLWLIGFLPGAVGLGMVAQELADARDETEDAEDGPARLDITAWVKGMWSFTGVLEKPFVVGINLCFAAFGIGMIVVGYPSVWMGWTAIIFGVVVAPYMAYKYVFPELALVIPLVLGVAMFFA